MSHDALFTLAIALGVMTPAPVERRGTDFRAYREADAAEVDFVDGAARSLASHPTPLFVSVDPGQSSRPSSPVDNTVIHVDGAHLGEGTTTLTLWSADPEGAFLASASRRVDARGTWRATLWLPPEETPAGAARFLVARIPGDASGQLIGVSAPSERVVRR